MVTLEKDVMYESYSFSLLWKCSVCACWRVVVSSVSVVTKFVVAGACHMFGGTCFWGVLL